MDDRLRGIIVRKNLFASQRQSLSKTSLGYEPMFGKQNETLDSVRQSDGTPSIMNTED